MTFSGMIASTNIDAHNTRITLDALKQAAFDINNAGSVPSIGIEHDPTVMPIGKVTKAYVKELEDGNYGLFCEGEFFSSFSTEIQGETYILQKSLMDTRPITLSTGVALSKLLVQTDCVNFASREEAEKFFEELSKDYEVDTGYIARKSLIPDPELVFHFLEVTVVSVLAYLSGKDMASKIGNHIIDNALKELDELYSFIKKAILAGAKRFIPANRPVTYVFSGHHDFLIELVVQTESPNVAIQSISADKLSGVMKEIEQKKAIFSNFAKIQLVYNVEDEKWEFNYIATEKGEIIGTEKSYKKSAKKVDILFPDNENPQDCSVTLS